MVKDKPINSAFIIIFIVLVVFLLYVFRDHIDSTIGSYLGAAGTIFLGVVAYTQNAKLLKVEEDSFLSNHTCSGFIKEIRIFEKAGNFTSLDDRSEQVVKSNAVVENPKGYKDLILRIRMDIRDSTPVMLRVKKLSILVNNLKYVSFKSSVPDQVGFPFELTGIDDKYSKAAVFENGIEFNILVLLSEEEKEDFLRFTNGLHCRVQVDLNLSLLTNEMVLSNLLCRSILSDPEFSEVEERYNVFRIAEDPPMYFWQGNEMENRKNVRVKGLSKQEGSL
ncbi:hypothetical protein [Gudongella oleilytica]|uniref:hypothetical protein n=1 Tax=Gudongella oleilytica TaxID=1582259 RepID=UPI002A35AF1F|nr:hypothetical protein [Gudongella oleilytica]MDY0257297.1 hypothetical protein [Gudongella oleilytica]